VNIDEDSLQALLCEFEAEHEYLKANAKATIMAALNGLSMEDCTFILGEVLITLRSM
jgi:hypothetical protein